MENIDKIYDKFIQKMVLHEQNYNISMSSINNELKELKNKYSNAKEDEPLYIERPIFYFWDQATTDANIYSSREVSLKLLKENMINNQNKQYQWLLVSAFEDYEKYLRDIYTFFIYIQNKPSEITQSDFFKYFEKIYKNLAEGNQRKNSSKILKSLRNDLTTYKNLEIKNAIEQDMRFSLSLIQFFRHVIVHNDGKTDNKNKLFEKIFTDVGLSCNIKDYCKKIFSIYFPQNTNIITLLEITVDEIPGVMKAQTTVLLNLFSILINSAYYIKNEIKEKYGV